MAEPYEKSDAYWQRETTANGRKVNDVLDKHQENVEWAKVARLPEPAQGQFYNDRHDAIQEKAAWRANFDKTGELVTPTESRAEFERQEAHNERLIRQQINQPWREDGERAFHDRQPSPSSVSYAQYLDDVAGGVNSGTAWKGHEDRMGGKPIEAWEPDASVMPSVPNDNLSRFDPARIEQQLNRDWRNAPEPEENRISARDQAERASFREAAWSSASSGATQSRQNNAQTAQQTLRM